MREVVLSELISYSKDGEWGKEKDSGSDVEMYVIRGTDFGDVQSGKFSNLPIRWIPRHIAENKKLEAGDVLIELAGGTENNPTGRTCFITHEFIEKSEKPLTVASFSRFIRFNSTKCDSRYIYWVLQYLHIYRIIKKYHVQHTGTARFQWTLFSNKEKINLPPLKIQRKIASILSAYDELIENNNLRIRLLEEMAEEIYKEWFVRLRFPGFKNTRFLKDDGSEVLHGTIGALPEGWEKKGVFDLAKVTYGFPFDSSKFTEEVAGMPIIRIRDIRNNFSKTYSEQEADEKYLIENGDFLVGMDGDFHVSIWAGNQAYLNQRVVRFRPQENIAKYFMFWSFKKEVDFLDKIISGTTVAHLSDKDLKKILIPTPTNDIMNLFKEKTDALFELRIQLSLKNQLLKETRDLLLPRLINGKLSVEHLVEGGAGVAAEEYTHAFLKAAEPQAEYSF